MKGGKSSKVRRRVSTLVALLALFRLSLAFGLPSNEQLHALTDLADTNANASRLAGGTLETWRFEWDANGTWKGGNPCSGYRGLKCWSTGDLRVLRASFSDLQGPISSAFGNLTSLSELTLAENQLSGDIVPILATMTWMKTLRLQGNNFTGSLSNWVQRMPKLQVLTLARNSLVGSISTGLFTNLTHLMIVDVTNNSLSGPIPDDIVSLPSLVMLLLGGNNFNGTVPPSLSNSTLSTVDLSGNSLTGRLPTDWNTRNLTSLDLSGNNLSGPIPQQLLNLNVENFTLNLARNSFVGNVSTNHSRKFGCDAFVGNPGLVMEDSKCNPSVGGDGSNGKPPAVKTKKAKSLSTLTVVALTVGDVALLLMSVVGFVLFCIWWRKKVINNQDGGDTKPYIAWPTSSKGDLSSTGTSVISSSSTLGPVVTTEARSSFATKPEIKPALKSVVGIMADPAKHNMTADVSISESFSCNDFGTNIVILDTTLTLEFDDLLRAKALVLGAGSHGVVYMACLDDGEMLAIKRIEELALAEEGAFDKQCEQLAEVLHPNLLQLRAYCWSSQEKLLIYDYMRNGSLHSILHADLAEGKSSPERVSIDWATRLKIAVGTARALAHLHDSDMVHGNIKASNVLLDEQFEPQVSDFGMEELLQKPLRKPSGASDGYLAPELCARATCRRTQDGDVYSLGVFLLELLTGKKPVENSVDLPTWVQEMTLANRTVQLFDPALTSMHVLPALDVLEFLELAQACVATDAAARPSITIVLRTLESIVPGSTAPRSYVKDDNIDSDMSLRETAHTPISPAIVMPVQVGGYYDASHSKDAINPFSPVFLKPLRVPKTRQGRPPEESGSDASPVSSSDDFYSNVSTPVTSPSSSPLASRTVGDSPPNASMPLLKTHPGRE